ncbi:uncharacterized protein O3C94_018608 [Discoglossus pictus]
MTASTDDESEEDFEEVIDQRIELPKNTSCRNSAEPRKSTTDTTSQGSYVNISNNLSYENVAKIPSEGGLTAPESRKDHTYLEVLPKEDEATKVDMVVVEATTDETTSSRARVSSQPEPHCSKLFTENRSHSYENITLEESPGSLISSVDLDYVNLS